MKSRDIISFFECLPDDTEVKLQHVYMDHIEIVDIKHISVKVLEREEYGMNKYEILLSSI